MKSFLLTGAATALLAVPTLAPAAELTSTFDFLDYDGSTFPEVGSSGLKVVGTLPENTRRVSDGIFTIDTQTTASNAQHRYTFGTDTDNLANPHLDRAGEGYIVEIGLAIENAERNMTSSGVDSIDATFQMVIMDRDSSTPGADTTTYYVGIDKLQVAVGLTTAAKPADSHVQPLASFGYTHAASNTFTIHRKGNTLNILLNGTSVMTVNDFAGVPYVDSKDPSKERSAIEFGDRSTSRDGIYHIDYLRAGTVSVPEPVGAASGGLLIIGSLAYRPRR